MGRRNSRCYDGKNDDDENHVTNKIIDIRSTSNNERGKLPRSEEEEELIDFKEFSTSTYSQDFNSYKDKMHRPMNLDNLIHAEKKKNNKNQFYAGVKTIFRYYHARKFIRKEFSSWTAAQFKAGKTFIKSSNSYVVVKFNSYENKYL